MNSKYVIVICILVSSACNMKALTIQKEKHRPKRNYTAKIREVDLYAETVSHYLAEVFGHNLKKCKHQVLIDYIETKFFESIELKELYVRSRNYKRRNTK